MANRSEGVVAEAKRGKIVGNKVEVVLSASEGFVLLKRERISTFLYPSSAQEKEKKKLT